MSEPKEVAISKRGRYCPRCGLRIWAKDGTCQCPREPHKWPECREFDADKGRRAVYIPRETLTPALDVMLYALDNLHLADDSDFQIGALGRRRKRGCEWSDIYAYEAYERVTGESVYGYGWSDDVMELVADLIRAIKDARSVTTAVKLFAAESKQLKRLCYLIRRQT